MSKPESTGESLESILASIRRSLAEQSTGMLEDEAAGPATLLPPESGTVDDADVPRLFGGSGAAATEARTGERELLVRLEDDPPPPASTLVPAPVQAAASASATVAAAPASLEDPPPPAPAALAVPLPPQPKDPFWFLSGRREAEKKDNAAPAAGPDTLSRPAAAGARAPEPKPVRTEIVRGPLPPFFGSSAEAAKVEVAPVPSVSAGAGMMPSAPAAAAPARALDADPPWSAPAEPPLTPAWPPASPELLLPAAPLIPPAARDGLLNGRASILAPPPAAPISSPAPAAGAAETTPHLRGLEAMVAELLRPMLRRWLDENMPRLVSAALKAEADLISKRDPKKP